MTQEEYSRLIEYLLTELQKIEAYSAINGILHILSRRKTIFLNDTELKEKRKKVKDFGKTELVSLNPKEAFEYSLEYLSKIIIDVPIYQQKIRATFGDNVVWKVDQNENISRLLSNEEFTLESITVKEEELQKILNNFQELKDMIHKNGDV